MATILLCGDRMNKKFTRGLGTRSLGTRGVGTRGVGTRGLESDEVNLAIICYMYIHVTKWHLELPLAGSYPNLPLCEEF